MKFEGLLGRVNKIDFVKYLYQQFDVAFRENEYRNETPFAKAYGVKGVYFSDLDEDIPSSPLVLIQSQDLAELVATKKLADHWADSEGYNDEAIQQLAQEISKTYLLENGMSVETYNHLNNIFGE